MRSQIACLFLFFLVLSSCNKTLKVKTGEDAYDVGQYSLAAELLESEWNNSRQNEVKSDKAFLLGQSYDKMNEPEKALSWYKQSTQDSESPSKLIYLAYALKNTGRYAEAITVFQQLGKQLNDVNRFRNELVTLNNVNQWQSDRENNPYKIKSSPFNSEAADYSPVISPGGQIVFTSDRPQETITAKYKWTGRDFSDIYVADSMGPSATLLKGLVNPESNEGSLIFSASGQEIVFCRCFDRVGGDQNCKLMFSKNIDGNWTDPQVLPFVADSINYLGPAFGLDSNILFFSLEDPKFNTGFDVYYSQRKEGVWGDAERLPPIINSEYNEKYISFDRDTMYFSSDQPSGMGGLDIYKTYVARGQWTPPQNLKSPMNSSYDDFGIYVDQNFKATERTAQKGFFSSNRKGGRGQDDIYSFVKTLEIPVVQKIDTPALLDKGMLVKLNVYTKGFEIVNGKFSKTTKSLDGAKVSIRSAGRDSSMIADKYGKATTIIAVNDAMNITAASEGYLTTSKRIKKDIIKIDSTKSIQEFNIIINLYPILYDQEIVIRDIYYDTDKYDIRKDAEGSLDELLSIMELNPSFKIKINSHTDCRASNAYNLKLSDNRAKSVVNYLTSKGISKSRLTSQGYGESRPLAICACEKCTDEELQLNRRTTFQLVK